MLKEIDTIAVAAAMDRNSSHVGLGGSDWEVGLWVNAHVGANVTALPFLTNLRITRLTKRRGSRATCRANSVELAELAPQHLRLEERRVPSG